MPSIERLDIVNLIESNPIRKRQKRRFENSFMESWMFETYSFYGISGNANDEKTPKNTEEINQGSETS